MKKQRKTPKLNKDFDITEFEFLRDLLLVKAIRPDSGELVDPAQYEDKPQFGKAIKVGKEVQNIKIGDIIRFGLYSTENIRTQGHDYYIVHEEDVTAVLK